MKKAKIKIYYLNKLLERIKESNLHKEIFTGEDIGEEAWSDGDFSDLRNINNEFDNKEWNWIDEQ